MKIRLITAAAIIAAGITILVVSGTIAYPIIIALISGISVFEILRVLGYDKKLPIAIPAYLIALALPASAYFSIGGLVTYAALLGAICYVYLLYMLVLSVLSKGKLKLSRMATVFCTVTYVTLAYTAISAIRRLDNGLLCLMTIFVSSWISDSFAFIVGKLIGKHKLIPEISPKKTVEGCIGGIVFATIAMLVFGLVIDVFFNPIVVNYTVLGLMGLVLSIISQVGDLVASIIKREEGVKDYGNILPGHGGITDRFDSVYTVAMLAFVVCAIFPPFV